MLSFLAYMWHGMVLQVPLYVAVFQSGFAIDPSGWMPYLEARTGTEPRGCDD